MKITLRSGTIEKLDTQVLVIPVFKGIRHMEDNIVRLDKRLNEQLSLLLSSNEEVADEYTFHFVFTQEKIKARRVLIAGLGDNTKVNAEKIRTFAGKLCMYLRSYGVTDFTVLSLGYGLKNIPIEEATAALTEGLCLGSYQFTEYKTRKDKESKQFRSISLFPINDTEEQAIRTGVERANIICDSVCMTRDLINQPPNVINPATFAQHAKKITRGTKIRCRVLDVNQLKKEKMGCLLGIGNGSIEKPKMVVLEYFASKTPLYALVGKGVTFDSGGLSLKPAKLMEEMKNDKGGASTVLGAMQAIARLKIPANIIGILPLIENMPSGSATKPGAVLRSANGKTVEVLNTDAEGRLILADALHYATKQKPAAIIDLATLTGACVIALGANIAGLFGTDQKLIERIRKASAATSERVWPMPLIDEFSDDLKSQIADLRNIGGEGAYEAGACTAAAFLKEFVGDIPWAHLDIAGPVWSKKDNSYISRGATGFGVRLLVQLFTSIAKEQT